MHKLLTILSLLLTISLTAQTPDLFEKISPRSIGPAGMSGRITSIAVHPTDENIIYVGAASGGVWKSTNRGISWNPIFDDQPTQSIGAITLDPNNPEVVWVGTGEGNPRNSHNSGRGLFMSKDGGENWTFKGLEKTKTIHRIIVNPLNSNEVYVGSLGSIWGKNAERGVYKTTDGGNTWKKALYKSTGTGCAELRMHPTNPNILLAAMWDFGRKPYTFNSGGPNSGIYQTIDGGKNWTRLEGHGLPEGPFGRIGLAFAPSNPNMVYALIETEEYAFYKSVDGGKNWSKQSDSKNIGNRPFYYAEIYVDPLNENRIFSLWTNISESIDGGKTWELTSPFKPYSGLHPDHHALFIHPQNPKFILNGNDGGLNLSDDGGKTWRFADNIPVGQFYHVSIDENSIPYRVAGGMQDNGSWVGPSSIWEKGKIKNHHWQEIYFGDGFDVMFTKDPSTVYAMSQGGNVGRINLETGKNIAVKPVIDDTTYLRFNWDAPIAADPFNDKGLYFGSQFVHYSDDMGDNWKAISPDLTTNDKAKQQQDSSGGLTLDVTKAENYTTVLVISPKSTSKGEIWVGTDDGNLQITKDGGANWQNISSKLVGAPRNPWIPQIVHSTINSDETFVVANNYRQNDFRPFLFHTKDGGKTFRNIAKGLPAFVRSVIQDHKEPNLIFCGTDEGLYYTLNGGGKWTQLQGGFPSCPVSDLKIHSKMDDLVIGTFGRSFWILDDIAQLRMMAQKSNILSDSLVLFPTSPAYLANYRSAKGLRFIADGQFVGENKPFGASITTWIKPHDFDPKTKMDVIVLDSNQDTVRQFKTKVDTGFFRLTWNLDADGIAMPSWKPAKKDTKFPSFGKVLPGEYTLFLKYNTLVGSTSVTVLDDPRAERSSATLAQREADRAKMMRLMERNSAMFDVLLDMKKQLNWYENQRSYIDESEKKNLDSLSKAIIPEIESLMDKVAGGDPDKVRGYVRSDYTTNSKLGGLAYKFNQRDGLTGSCAVLYKQAKTLVDGVAEDINSFIDSRWMPLVAKLKAAEQLPADIPKIKSE